MTSTKAILLFAPLVLLAQSVNVPGNRTFQGAVDMSSATMQKPRQGTALPSVCTAQNEVFLLTSSTGAAAISYSNTNSTPPACTWTPVGGGGGGGSTIPSTTNLIAGNGTGNGADSGIAPNTVVSLTGTQSLTNKTLDGISPAIMGYLANITSDVQTQVNGKQAALGYTPLNAASNLSDVGNQVTARTNLGLGSAATQPSSAFEPAQTIAFGLQRIGATLSVNTASIPSNAILQSGSVTDLTTTSTSATTYTATMSPTLTTYTAGQVLTWPIGSTACTAGPITLNIDTLGAKSVFEADGSTNPVSADCAAGRILRIAYDGTAFRIVGGGATGGGGSGTGVTVNCAATMSSNVATCTGSPAPTSLTGMIGSLTVSAPNTGAWNLNINNLGAKSVLWYDGSTPTSGQMAAGLTYLFSYNGTNFIVTPAVGPQGPQGSLGNSPIYTSSLTMSAADSLNTPVFNGTNLVYTMLATPPTATFSTVVCNASPTSNLTINATTNAAAIYNQSVPANYVLNPSPVAASATCKRITTTPSGTQFVVNEEGSQGPTGATGATGATGPTGPASSPATVTVSTSGPVTVSGPFAFYFNNSTGALTFNLPTITSGLIGDQFCFRNSATRTGQITLQLPASTQIDSAGALGTVAGTYVSPGSLGDGACVVAVSTTLYAAYPTSGTWTAN